MTGHPSSVQIRSVYGRDIEQVLPELAALRIRVFRDFPYLYDGTEDYERRYLRTYIDCPDSIAVLAFDGQRMVGASNGLPLAAEPEDMTRPFSAHGFDVARIFYCAESVLLPEYRGLGLGHAFFDARENHARSLGRFDWSGFCAVQRPSDHPRRPASYRPLDPFWRKRGYEPRPDLMTTLSWKDVDEATDSPKPMMYWLKRLDA